MFKNQHFDSCTIFTVTLDEHNNCVLTEVRKFTFRVINS